MFTLFCEDFFLSVYENMDGRDKKGCVNSKHLEE